MKLAISVLMIALLGGESLRAGVMIVSGRANLAVYFCSIDASDDLKSLGQTMSLSPKGSDRFNIYYGREFDPVEVLGEKLVCVSPFNGLNQVPQEFTCSGSNGKNRLTIKFDQIFHKSYEKRTLISFKSENMITGSVKTKFYVSHQCQIKPFN